MVAFLLASLPGCWLTDDELALALRGEADADTDVDADSDADGDTDTDTGAAPYTCEEGESQANGDAPGDDSASWGATLIGIASGSFCMGSSSGNTDEKPVHPVTLTRAFWIGETEVTQDEYEALTTQTPSYNAGCGNCPVEQLSWYEAATFANNASDEAGLDRCYTTGARPAPVGDPYDCEGYRLPTEAEWEYAARAGEAHTYAGGDDADAVAWTDENTAESQLVGRLEPNAWGLYDMSGNVTEYTGDWLDSEYYAESPSTDPAGAESGTHRAMRGGSWYERLEYARVTFRNGDVPDGGSRAVGLRLARTAP